MEIVTGDQVREAMKAANITHVEHHECGCCGQMVYYSRDGDQLFFNPGCGCSWTPRELRSWDEAAYWINMQSKAEWREKLMILFGLTPNGAELRGTPEGCGVAGGNDAS